MLRATASNRRWNGSSLDQKMRHAVTGSPWSSLTAFNSDVTDELPPEHIAAGLPGTADLMVLVGNAWWRCAYAARGGNWPLAAFYTRRVRALQRRLAIIRPKYKERLERYEADMLAPVFKAIEAQDRAAFDRAYAAATDDANKQHVETGYGYIRWKLPDEAPQDVDLGPQKL
jgi:hypothetical protein